MGGPKPQIELDADEDLGPDVTGRYRVAGVEVTQAVQDMHHSVPLVAGKQTMIRVYLDRPDPAVVTVRGEVEITGEHGTAAVPSLDTLELDGAANGDITTRRAGLVTSLNFLLPGNVNVAGSWTVRISSVVTADTGIALIDADPGFTQQFDLIDTPPLRVRVVSIRHQAGNPLKNFEPAARDYEMFASWLRRAYPVPQVIISRVTTDAAQPWPFSAVQINAQVTAIRNLDIASGEDPLTHYVAIVSDGDGRTFMRGKASGIPSSADASAVASAPVGARLYPWDTDGCYGDWYAAHELAHTLGRRHVGTPCGDAPADPLYPFPEGALSNADEAFVGLDMGDPALGVPTRVFRGTQSHDLMCYCPFIWMSAYTYSGILTRIGEEAADVIEAGPPMIALAVEDEMAEQSRWLNVIGTVDFTERRGSIDYVQPLTATDVPAGGDSPDVTIALFEADDTLIEVRQARVKLDVCRDDDENEEGVVDTYVPASDRIARIELRLNDEPVASFSAPAQREPGLPLPADPPSLAPQDRAGPAIARDLAPNVRYNVQVSPDDGTTWRTVAVDIADPDAQSINRSDFPGSGQLRRRIFATDGFRTWSVSDDVI